MSDTNNVVADRGIVRVATLSAIYERQPEGAYYILWRFPQHCVTSDRALWVGRIPDPIRERVISLNKARNQAYVVSSRASESLHPQMCVIQFPKLQFLTENEYQSSLALLALVDTYTFVCLSPDRVVNPSFCKRNYDHRTMWDVDTKPTNLLWPHNPPLRVLGKRKRFWYVDNDSE